MNITLTGNLGSGKGSVSDIFKSWGFGYVSGGDLFRGVAREKGLTVIEMNELAKKDRTIDDMIDARSTRLGDELDHTLFDSRLAWHFVRTSFKVFLLVDTDESARRVYNGNNREMEEYQSQEDCADGLQTRAGLERDRFRSLYDIDYYDMQNYDLIIESTNATPEQIASEILRNYEEYQQHPFTARVLLNLKAMYPQQPLTPAQLEQIRSAAGMASDNTLADGRVSILSAGGYNYIEGDAAALFAQVAAGKVFGEVASFRSAKVAPVPDEALRQIEEVCGFTYRAYPQTGGKKHPYMMDLTR